MDAIVAGEVTKEVDQVLYEGVIKESQYTPDERIGTRAVWKQHIVQ